MIWFLIAALTYSQPELVSFKINQTMKFNTEDECLYYLKTYDEYLIAGIKRNFPEANYIEIRCIDIENAMKLQEQLNPPLPKLRKK